jgi:hypothetical protein
VDQKHQIKHVGTHSKQLLLLRIHCKAIRTAMNITKTFVRLEIHIMEVLEVVSDTVGILNVVAVEEVEDKRGDNGYAGLR